MQTRVFNCITDSDYAVNNAVEWLISGIPIAFPTETVYGIGAGLFDINGVENVFKIKGRNFSNPLSAHISTIKDVELLCKDVKDDFYKLAEAFLPGPLSIVMKKRKEVPDIVTGGGNTLSIRVPDNDIFRKLSQKFSQPIAATSANKSGKPSPVIAEHVFDDLNGLVPVILDSGKCRYQIESTVLSLVEDKPILIRPGAISQSKIRELLGKEIISLDRQITLFESDKSSLKNSKFEIICLDNSDEIIDFMLKHPNKRLLVMSRSDKFKGLPNFTFTNELSFFQDLRNAEKNEIDYLVVEKDDYVMSSEVLRHRLKIT